MSPLVVLFAIVGAVCCSLVPAQPVHLPALVLDPHGRPLETAEVINARVLHLQAKALDHLDGHSAPLHAAIVPAVQAPLIHAPLVAPAAVSHQSRVDIHTSEPVISHAVHAAPLVAAHSVSAWPAFGHGLSHGLEHLLKKRSLSLGHLAYASPIVAHAPAAVSHQSRVDIHSSPAIVAHAVHAPIIEHAVHAPIAAHAVAAPVVAHAIPAAVSHQSRVDVRTSHPVISHAVHAPLVATHSISDWPSYGHGLSHGLGHLLKKRSLALAHVLPSAVSHQSRVDVITSHAAAIAHAPVAVAHAAPVAIVSSHITPLAHSAVWSAPAAHWAHSSLALASHW